MYLRFRGLGFVVGSLLLLPGLVRAQQNGSTPNAAPTSKPALEAQKSPRLEESSAEQSAEERTEEQEEVAATEDESAQSASAQNGPPSNVPTTLCHNRRISTIKVTGNRRVSPQDIIATMRSKVGTICRDEQIALDAQAIWDLGYFDDIVFDAKPRGKNAVALTVHLDERPSIASIEYEGNSELDGDELDDLVDLREGEVLSKPLVASQIANIRDGYAEEGYFLAKVEYEIKPVENNEVVILFKIEEGHKVTVRRVRFSGNRHLSDDELQGIMQTKETGVMSFLSSDDTFKRNLFEEDVNRLQAYYYDKGYLTADIGEPSVQLTPDRRFIDITIAVVEGPRFRVGKMGIKEVDASGRVVAPLGGRKKLRGMLNLDRGDWFSSTQIQKDLLEITRIYRDKGYAKVLVQPQTDLHTKERVVDITVAITRGPLVRIERIQIQGNTKTADHVIRREARIMEGELYNQTKVERSKERMLALGYFERVDVSEQDGSSPDEMVITFEVAERSTGTFQVGAGFSSIESFILTAQVQQNNIFGTGQSLSLQLQLSGIRQLGQIRFVEPYLFDTEWTLSLDAYRTIRQYDVFLEDRTGGSLALGHPILLEDLRLFLQYTGEYIDVSSQTGGFFNTSARGAQIFPRLPLANLYRDGLTSSLRLSLVWDSRDNRLFPTKGVYSSLSTEVADRFFASDNVFVRHSAFARFYYPIFDGFVLKLNTEAGLITSRLDRGVPIYQRFRLGGINTMRGYFLGTLGPRIGVPSSTDPNALALPQGAVVGGNLQAFYNLELEFNIVEAIGLKGVLFTDGGNTWNLEKSLCNAPPPELVDSTTDPCNADITQIRTSLGFGLRWFSQVLPPLRFEWGFPLAKRSYEQPLVFEFSFGNSF